MPTYDYLCGNCQQSFEIFQSITESPLLRCPACQQDTMQRLISAGAGIIFKGSGYYVNDSRASSAGSSSGGKKPSKEGATAEPTKGNESKSKELTKGEPSKNP